MSRNSESRFATVPHTNIQRSKLKLDFNHKTTFNAGSLIPFYVDMDILPGDTFNINTSMVVRLQTPKDPTMDNLYLDYYYFFIPNRILWEHAKEFYGENTAGAWGIQTEYLLPKLTTPTGGMAKGTIADYMGIPIGVANLDFQALPIRAMTKIYNEWFRDQNLIAPDTEYTDDTDRTADNNVSALGGKCYKVAKFHDYFTSCLPEPQKPYAGITTNPNGITLPLGISAPVKTGATQNTTGWTNMIMKDSSNNLPNNALVALASSGELKRYSGGSGISGSAYTPANLTADLTNATAASINALRLAFATQRILEKDARGGTRYREVIASHFNTTIPDSRAMIPEYLGGKRVPINIDQIAQTSSTDATSPQGNLAGYSQTNDVSENFTKSFTEWGIIIGCLCVRNQNTYQQGLNRSWSRRHRLDVYWPSLANLGEGPVYNREIYAQGNSVVDTDGNIIDDQVFGYQERWAEYRYKPNRISGEMRSTYATPLDSWHYADNYASLPVLAQNWIESTPDYIDRTIAVGHTVSDQFKADILVYGSMVRPMPVYSVPGLLDHF